jgi:hypothetical protein
MTFCSNNKTCVNKNIEQNDKRAEDVGTTEFISLQIMNNVTWKTH